MAKFADGHKEQMEDQRTGKTYCAGVALAQATKTAKAKHTATERNPKGTAPEDMRCPYHHPLYCTILGHNTASNKSCFAKHKNKEERKVILATIKRLQIKAELAVQADGMFFLSYSFYLLKQFSNFDSSNEILISYDMFPFFF